MLSGLFAFARSNRNAILTIGEYAGFGCPDASPKTRNERQR